jgi:glutamine amidotransferase
MAGLSALGADDMIRRRVAAGLPLLGICVGHQVLFSSGVEHGQRTAGVGVYPGTVERVPARRLPHMGWNQVWPGVGSTLFDQERRYYFVHSYAALTSADVPADATCSWTTHDGVDLIAAVEWGSVLSCQFHPEKSGQAGLALLRRWLHHVEVR